LNPRRSAFVLSSLVLLVLLSSCVDVDATANITASGSGRLAVHYAVSRMVSPVGALEASTRMIPFPVSRGDFESAVAATPGLSLVSYAAEERSDDIAVDVAISFSTPAALASFLDPAGKRAIYSDTDGKRSLRLTIAEGGAELDPEVVKLVETAFASYTVKLAVVLPSRVLSAGIGKASGMRAEYASTITALVENAQPVIWEIVW
jgi:hypothetical protein